MSWEVVEPARWDRETAIILAHGAGQGIQSPFMQYFHSALAEGGLLAVHFNFEYMEAGRKIPDPQPKMQALYRQVVAEVLSKYQPKRVLIGGKSMGGRVASYITANTPEVDGLVFLGYPLHPPGKKDQLRDQHLYTIEKPMLFLSGTRDTFAERSLLESVIHKIGQRASLVWIEGGDHSLKVKRSGTESWKSAVETILRWARDLRQA